MQVINFILYIIYTSQDLGIYKFSQICKIIHNFTLSHYAKNSNLPILNLISWLTPDAPPTNIILYFVFFKYLFTIS